MKPLALFVIFTTVYSEVTLDYLSTGQLIALVSGIHSPSGVEWGHNTQPLRCSTGQIDNVIL